MKQFIKNNWPYFLLYFFVLSYAAYYLLQYDKVALHLKINSLVGNSSVDAFFKYFTHVGDGLFAFIIGILFLFFNIRKGIFILTAYVFSGLLTSFLKNYVYSHISRPHFVFGYFVPNAKINYVKGVEMVGLNSFPSGHATSAFALFTCLALITENKYLKILFFIFALTAAFSRTYLSQHWLIDITVGSLIGTLTATLFYFIFIGNNKLQKLNKPIFNVKKN